jgi:hypothetical protein
MISINPLVPGLSSTVKTGKDGTFHLAGFGRERVVRLAIREKDLEYTDLSVLTTRTSVDSALMAHGIYGPTWKHLAVPSRPIVGTVRDKRTGKALAGIQVSCNANLDQTFRRVRATPEARATTDTKGQYRLNGMGKHEFYQMHAGASPYFRQDKFNVKDAPGLEPLTVDFDLDQGIVVRGLLTDKVTGKPVRAQVQSSPLTSNPNRKDYARPYDNVRTAEDGSYTLLAIPGPGLLLFLAEETDRYARTEVINNDALRRDLVAFDRRTTPSRFHAILRINPSEKATRATVHEVTLEPGVTRPGTVVGPDEKPLAGVFAAGLSPIDISRTSPFKLPGVRVRDNRREFRRS